MTTSKFKKQVPRLLLRLRRRGDVSAARVPRELPDTKRRAAGTGRVASPELSSSAHMLRADRRRPWLPPGQVARTPPALLLQLLLLLLCCAGAPQGAPVLLQGLQPEQELQLWSELEDACSSFPSSDPQPQASNALEELCFAIMGTPRKSQDVDEKDNAKRVRLLP
ncbi:neuromedin-U [Erinaceus europaeus]|uniref:Neuromedin-U n=1 Tax=Erinaceus europaeus TaxID=9365 RepID=A0ABM3X6K5_ERIEU|nr:neuromedin-U [Erinaceus europaeus]